MTALGLGGVGRLRTVGREREAHEFIKSAGLTNYLFRVCSGLCGHSYEPHEALLPSLRTGVNSTSAIENGFDIILKLTS
ncbi:MAG TPA: hypothetical protein VLX29_02675 [Nitrospirota bacterium]|nr:hypothetical protein [Nitrospirota bacterium]